MQSSNQIKNSDMIFSEMKIADARSATILLAALKERSPTLDISPPI
jgi:hypothetical protein